MKRLLKFTAIVMTLLVGWSVIIWTQWSQNLDTSINLIGMPLMMLAMAFLAVLAAQGKNGDFD